MSGNEANDPVMGPFDKAAAMAELVRARRSARHPKHRSLNEISGGGYDCDFVSPWTKSAWNMDADLMIVGQDWVSEPFLQKRSDVLRQLGYDPQLPTNKNLQRLLQEPFGITFADTCATNVFIFLKAGDMSAPVSMTDLVDCAQRFLLSQIEIVRPLMAICLGQATFNSVRRALRLPAVALNEAARPTGHTKYLDTEIYGSPHLGARGMANAGGLKSVAPQWQLFANRLATLKATRRDRELAADTAELRA